MSFFKSLWNGIKSVGKGIGSALTGNPLGFISSAVDIGKSIFGSNSASKEQAKQNEFNATEAEKNRQFQAEQSQIQRDWQSPVAQMQRYSEAGLNPNLVYGQMQQAPVSGVAGAQAQSVGMSGKQQLALAHFNIAEKISEMKVQQAQANDLNASAEQKRADAKRLGISNEYDSQTLQWRITSAWHNMQSSAHSDRLGELAVDVQEIETSIRKSLHANDYDTRFAIDNLRLDNLVKIATLNNLEQNTDYIAEMQEYVGYNAETGRISANALALNAKSYAQLLPYLCYQASEQAGLFRSQAEHTDKDAELFPVRALKTFMEAYKLYQDGTFTQNDLVRLVNRNFNLVNYGAEEPSKGGVFGTGLSWQSFRHAGSGKKKDNNRQTQEAVEKNGIQFVYEYLSNFTNKK